MNSIQHKILQQKINDRLMKDDVRGTVRKLIQEHKNDTTKVMDSLAAKGLITQLNSDLNSLFLNKENENSSNLTNALKMFTPPSNRYLSITLQSGKAFIDARPNTTMELTFTFSNSQRSPTFEYPSAVDPKITEVILFDMSHCNHAITALSDKVGINLVEKETRKLISATSIDLRTLLMNSSGCVELDGVDLNSGSVVGLFNIQVKLHDASKNAEKIEIPESEILLTEMEVERRRKIDKNRLFRAYCERWVEEYNQISENYKNRKQTHHALDENNNFKPVCSFIPKLDASRVISSPRVAARFVSCLEDDNEEGNLMWRSILGTVLSRKCNAAVRACFLVGILNNSFALDAWVVSGTKVKDGNLVPYFWVVQRDSSKRVTFIEPSSAKRYTDKKKRKKLN